MDSVRGKNNWDKSSSWEVFPALPELRTDAVPFLVSAYSFMNYARGFWNVLFSRCGRPDRECGVCPADVNGMKVVFTLWFSSQHGFKIAARWRPSLPELRFLYFLCKAQQSRLCKSLSSLSSVEFFWN